MSASPQVKQHGGLAERVTGAVFWNSVFVPVKTLLTFASSLIVVRLLSQSDYAVFGSVLALLTAVGLWSDLGIESTLSRFFPEVELRFGRAGVFRFALVLLTFKFVLLALILIGLSLALNAVSAYFRFGEDAQTFLTLVAVLLFFGIVSDFILQFLLSNFNQKATNALDISFAIAHPILVVAFLYLGWGVPGVLGARALATVIYVALGLAAARLTWQRLQSSPSILGDWRDLYRRFARLSSLYYLNSAVLFFSDVSFVVFVLNFYRDWIGVALFTVAFSRVMTPIRQFLMAPLVGISVPMFARLYIQHDMAKLRAAYCSLSRFLILILIPSGIGVAILAPNLIRILFQSRYEPAAAITVILVLGLFTEAILGPADQVLIATEQIRPALFGRMLNLAAIPLLFLTIPAFGPVGAAVSISTVRAASRLYLTAAVRSKFDLTFPLGFLLKVLFASCIMAIAMLLALGLDRPHDPVEAAVRTGLAIAVGSATFLIAFKRLGSIESDDRERLAALRIPFKGLLLSWL